MHVVVIGGLCSRHNIVGKTCQTKYDFCDILFRFAALLNDGIKLIESRWGIKVFCYQISGHIHSKSYPFKIYYKKVQQKTFEHIVMRGFPASVECFFGRFRI